MATTRSSPTCRDSSTPGFPIAEVASDGSSVITKHPGTGGMVTVGTVTAQLLYEIGGPDYLNPDVTADFETIHLEQDGRDRVRISGTRGLRAARAAQGRDELPRRLPQLAHARPDGPRRRGQGGSRAAHHRGRRAGAGTARRATPRRLAAASELDVAELAVALDHSAKDDPQLPTDAQSFLRLTVKDPDGQKAGKPFTAPVIEATLSSYPGLFPTTPPGPASPYGVYWPTTVARDRVPVSVTVDGDDVGEVAR